MARPLPSSSSRNWEFTINNPEPGEAQRILDTVAEKGCWCVIGEEVGAEGTPHLQGTVTFQRAVGLPGVRRIISYRAHYEISNGTPDQRETYCKKGNNWIECGTKPQPQQGKRNDIHAFAEAIREHGIQHAAIQMPDVYIKYSGGAERLASRFAKDTANTKRPLNVIWVYGPTGSGKTHFAWEMTKTNPKDAWWSGKTLRWWDHYDGESVAIFDEFRRDACTLHELLRILDEYPMRVEVKYGCASLANLRTVIITSCFHPRDVYQTFENIEQLTRRIAKIYYLCSRGAEPIDVTDQGTDYPGKHFASGGSPDFISPDSLPSLFSTQSTTYFRPPSPIPMMNSLQASETPLTNGTETIPEKQRLLTEPAQSPESRSSTLPMMPPILRRDTKRMRTSEDELGEVSPGKHRSGV